ncbi:MAG: FIST N-terminal domain-containing protein [Campylobacterota bacterium]|nr:FIST N-terminal domain-containing protein [Campylobacterota bacterium]
MKTLTIEYESNEQIDSFIEDHSLRSEDNVLVQIFTAVHDEEFIKSLINNILKTLPKANILGSTTCGEISNNGSLTNSTVISFSVFQNTKIVTKIINAGKDSFETGKDIINSFPDNQSDDLKLMISFADGLNTNGEEYLNGISSINDSLVVSGGLAGDYEKFVETFVFTQDGILNCGAVAAGFYNKDLNVNTDYSFNWESVGKKHIVEESIKNRVYKIGGMTPVDFYTHYLGDDISRLLPAIGIEFPLVIKKDGVVIARSVLTKHDDGSLSFAGNIPEGSVVQFGHGDVQMIINKGVDNIKNIIENPVESIFIYSCMARRALLQDDINLEILPMKEIAPISGFFTYGEFYHNCKNNSCNSQLLNQTMTIVAISESLNIIEAVTPNIFSHNPPHVNDTSLHRTQALSNLIERTTKELEELNSNLEDEVSKEIEKNIEKDSMLQIMQSQIQLGEMMEMIIHQWRQPLSAITSTTSSLQVYKETGILSDDILDSSFENILSYTDHLNSTIQDFRDLFSSNIKLEKMNSEQLIKKSLSIIKPILEKKKIKLVQKYSCTNSVNLSVGLLMQVILNIVKNAIDILLEKKIEDPKVKLSTFPDGKYSVIEISDNGGGIPEDILDKIFDKRFTTKKGGDGTGIGLDMSKTIVETKLNGEISAHNDNGWAVFTIKLLKE